MIRTLLGTLTSYKDNIGESVGGVKMSECARGGLYVLGVADVEQWLQIVLIPSMVGPHRAQHPFADSSLEGTATYKSTT